MATIMLRAVVLLGGLTAHINADNHGLLRQNLRRQYEYVNDYTEDTCGKVEWVAIEADAHTDSPAKSVVAGYDRNIKENLYICRLTVDGWQVPGKTWFERSDSCCNVGHEGSAAFSKQCEVLTVSSRAHGGTKLAWAAIDGTAKSNQLVPTGALKLGNDEINGNLFSCRFRDDNGDMTNGNTYFPRIDGSCCTAEYGNGIVKSDTCEVLVEQRC